MRRGAIRLADAQPTLYLQMNLRIFIRKSPITSAAVSGETLQTPEGAKREPDRAKPQRTIKIQPGN